MAKIYFIDFEASSLDSGSVPIEVGWVDDTGQGESYLIQPQAHWTNWSPQSQKIHGISRETLERDGKPAREVAKRLYGVLQGAILISDNPAYDEYWLATLLDAAALPHLSISHMNSLVAQQIERFADALNAEPPDTPLYWRRQRLLLDEAQILVSGAIHSRILGHKTIHRALPDAEFLWLCWQSAKTAIEQRIRDAQQQIDH
jgi:hypothetical protein